MTNRMSFRFFFLMISNSVADWDRSPRNDVGSQDDPVYLSKWYL